MNISSLTSKGQITIPAPLREQFLLQPGDKVRFEVIDGNLVLKPVKKTLETLAGCFSKDIGNLKTRNTIIGPMDDFENETTEHWEPGNGLD